MKSAFIATCPDSDEATIVVLGVTTLDEFRAAAAAQGLIRTCDDEEGYEFCKPLQAFAVVKPEGVWDLGASADTPGALPAMVATARWVDFTSCQCEGCPVHEGTHKPAEAVHQIAEPAASVEKQIEDVIGMIHNAIEEPAKGIDRVNVVDRIEKSIRTLLSSAQSMQPKHATQACNLASPLEVERFADALRTVCTDMVAIGNGQHALSDVARDKVEALQGVLFSAAPQAVQAAEEMRVCNNEECSWIGPLSETYGYKHFTAKLCPECKETTELAAPAHPAQGVPVQEVQAAIDRFDAYFRSANGVPPNARVSVPTAEWQELRAMLSTHPTQQGMDAIAALQKVRDIAVSALLTGSLDRQDWIDDMDRIAAQAKLGGAA